MTGKLYAHMFFELMFAATAATIISGALAERVTMTASFLYSLIITGTYAISIKRISGPSTFKVTCTKKKEKV